LIQIGDKVRFTPSANTDHSSGFPEILAVEVEGTVVLINEEHRWYRVRCELPGGAVFHECFPLPIEETEPAPVHGYKRCFDGGSRPMGQAYGNKHIR